MKNVRHFNCVICEARCTSSDDGILRGCEHYPPELAYSEKWDAWYRLKDDTWAEDQCGDSSCGYCGGRPAKYDHKEKA